MNITVLALSGGGERHHQEEVAQKETWAKDPESDFQVIWVHGSETDERRYDEISRRLIVPVEENYSNLLAKRVTSLKWALEKYPSQFYILTNCSGYINLKLIEPLLKSLPNEDCYAGPSGTGFENGRGYFYIGGGFVVVSRNVAVKISNIDVNKYVGISDDLAMGIELNHHGIQARPIEFCNLAYGHKLENLAYIRVRHLIKPRVTLKRLYEVDAYVKSGCYPRGRKIREIWRLLTEALPHQYSLRKAVYELRKI